MHVIEIQLICTIATFDKISAYLKRIISMFNLYMGACGLVDKVLNSR